MKGRMIAAGFDKIDNAKNNRLKIIGFFLLLERKYQYCISESKKKKV
jgi:hypothetical protein